MSDRSFVRFGGYAGILLALTSWAAVVEFYALSGGELFQWLYALIAFWAVIGIVAVYYRVRANGEAWAFFASLVGAVASLATVAASVYQAALLRAVAQGSVAKTALDAPSAANPFGVWTFGVTSIWFLVVALLMFRGGFPRLLALLGLVAFADLVVGFAASALGLPTLATLAAVVAGGVGGPIFWLWFGILLLRD